jgi:glycosyltransferase involved in cell wall biosynthesis
VIVPWWVTIWGPAFRFIITRLETRMGFRCCILIHNTMPHEARPLDRSVGARTLESVDRYIVMTEKEKGSSAGTAARGTKYPGGPVADLHAFKPTPMTQQKPAKRAGSALDQSAVLLYFGFIRPYKGLGVLIDALKLIVEQGISTSPAGRGRILGG